MAGWKHVSQMYFHAARIHAARSSCVSCSLPSQNVSWTRRNPCAIVLPVSPSLSLSLSVSLTVFVVLCLSVCLSDWLNVSRARSLSQGVCVFTHFFFFFFFFTCVVCKSVVFYFRRSHLYVCARVSLSLSLSLSLCVCMCVCVCARVRECVTLMYGRYLCVYVCARVCDSLPKPCQNNDNNNIKCLS